MNLLIDINRKQSMELRENHFINDVQGHTIYFAQKNDRTGDISDVQIFRHNEKDFRPPSWPSGQTRSSRWNILRVDLVDARSTKF